MTTVGTSALLGRTFARGRSAPRPILGAPDLPWSHQDPRETEIVDRALVHVRKLPRTSQLGVRHFWRFATVDSWKISSSIFTEGNSNLIHGGLGVGGGLTYLHRWERGHPNPGPCRSWLPGQQGDACSSNATLDRGGMKPCEQRRLLTPHYRRPWPCRQTGLQYRQTLLSQSLQQNHTTFLL